MESLAGDFFHKIPETLNPLDIGVFMIQQITTQGARPSSRLSPIISTSNPLPLTHWAVPSMLSPAKPYRWWSVSIRADCGLPSLDCRPSLGIKPGCGDPAEERRYTYTYRLTFWHIINTFLLLAGGNLRKNQIQHSQNTPVLCFWRTKQPGSPSPGWVCVNSALRSEGPTSSSSRSCWYHESVRPGSFSQASWRRRGGVNHSTKVCRMSLPLDSSQYHSRGSKRQRPQRSCGEKIIISPKTKMMPGRC